MQAEQKHPADELAKCLARANGILTLLSGCYEKESGNFATGTAYVNESILAVEQILATANDAMTRLYEMCDLTIVRAMPESLMQSDESAVVEPSVQEPQSVLSLEQEASTRNYGPRFTSLDRASHTQASAPAESYLGFFGPNDGASRMSDRLDTVLSNPAPKVQAAEAERPAQNYDELLAKITAVADKAAYRAHHAPTEPSLVPELEALRADLLKMRHVA